MVIAICDDDKLFAERTKRYLEERAEAKRILLYSNYEVLLADIHSYLSPDLVLMDMDWKKPLQEGEAAHSEAANGMVLAEQLMKYSPKTKILYVTAYVDHFAERMFLHDANVIGFLSKPLDTKLLDQYLDKAVRAMEQDADHFLELSTQRTKINVRLRDILYVECEDHTVNIVMTEGSQTVFQTLNSLAEQLPENFMRVHKSYIVNLDQVRNISRQGIELKTGGKRIPVGRSFYEEVRRQYMLRLAKMI